MYIMAVCMSEMKRFTVISVVSIVVAALLFASCVSDVKTKLQTAERICPFDPDTAFALLEEVHEDIRTSEQRDMYDMVWAEAYYIRHRIITDSIDSVLSRIETTPGTGMHLMRKIFRSVYLYDIDDVQRSFDGFESCSRELDVDIHPYWKALVEDYFGIIYLTSGFVEESGSHFYKVLDYAQTVHDPEIKANAYSHVSTYHREMGQLDSALYYATKVLDYYALLDSQLVSIAYHNLANIQMAISKEQDSNILETLHLARRFDANTVDSLSLCAMMSQAYYLQGKRDSAYIWKLKVDGSGNNISKFILYRFLSDYYQELNNTDSAYKYLRLYAHMDSVCLRNKPIKEILNTVHKHEKADVEKKYAKTVMWIIVGSVFILVSIAMLLRIRHKRRMDGANERIENQDKIIESQDTVIDGQDKQIEMLDKEKKQLSDDLNVSFRKISDIEEKNKNALNELEETSVSLSKAKRKIRNYRTIIEKKNSELMEANRIKEKYELNKKYYSSIIIQNFLDKSVFVEEKMDKAKIESVIESYAASEENRKVFVKSLSRYAPGLNYSGILICILYNEGFSDKEIISMLNCSPDSFRVSKSRTRSEIDIDTNKESVFVKRLLQKFDCKK